MAFAAQAHTVGEWPSDALRRRDSLRHSPRGREWNGIAGETLLTESNAGVSAPRPNRSDGTESDFPVTEKATRTLIEGS